jgi:hypothetical protein
MNNFFSGHTAASARKLAGEIARYVCGVLGERVEILSTLEKCGEDKEELTRIREMAWYDAAKVSGPWAYGLQCVACAANDDPLEAVRATASMAEVAFARAATEKVLPRGLTGGKDMSPREGIECIREKIEEMFSKEVSHG